MRSGLPSGLRFVCEVAGVVNVKVNNASVSK